MPLATGVRAVEVAAVMRDEPDHDGQPVPMVELVIGRREAESCRGSA